MIAGHSWCNRIEGRLRRKAPALDSFQATSTRRPERPTTPAYDDEVPDARAVVDAWEALFRAQVAVLRDVSSEFPDGPVTIGEYDLLFNLSRLPEHRARPRDLHQHLLLSQPSVSRLIDRLAERGFVSKTADPHDGRGIIVTLTDEGLDAYRRTAPAHAASIIRRFGERLDTEELATLTRLCDRLQLGA